MREGKKLSRLVSALAAGIALAVPAGGRAQTGQTAQPVVQPFRVCADPDNLPFSSSASGPSGLYVELGQELAHALGRPFTPVWSVSYFGKRTVRTTLLAGTCDAYIGLPDDPGFMGPRLVFSKPFLQIGYAIMAPPGQRITGLDDLRGKRVAVQFSTPPHLSLSSRDDIRVVTFLSPDEAAKALVRHEVDAAFIWGPTAGNVNVTTLNGAYQVIPIAGEGMQWPVAIGFAKANGALRDQVDKVLDAKGDAVAGLAAKYGFPSAAPVVLAGGEQAVGLIKVAATTTADQQTPASTPAPAQASLDAKPAEGAQSPSAHAGDADAGHEAFNGTCSHCHGPDAVQSERRINLRLLHHRYGDRMDEVFLFTVTHGRPDKGMPNWSGVLSEQVFADILAYLQTVQTP
ncbi:MAG: transporter substrate-binding domain-containing protein [Rhodopila sp.]